MGEEWYYDATKDAPKIELVTSYPGSGSWVQLTRDCAAGVRVQVADPTIVAATGPVRARDGNDVAVLLVPRHAGTTTITVLGPHHSRRTLEVRVRNGSPAPSLGGTS